MKRLRLLAVIPVLAIVLGAVLAIGTRAEHRHVQDEARQEFERHARSVAGLTREAMGQAAAAVDLVYSLAEEGLAASAALRAQGDGMRAGRRSAHGGLLVWLTEEEPGSLAGDWGPVPEDARRTLLAEVLRAEAGALVESATMRKQGLYCAHFPIGAWRRIACSGLDELRRLRRETGIGPLLSKITGSGLLYVAIQDPDGVVARSPAGGPLSLWEEDSFLERTRRDASGLHFRFLRRDGRLMFEAVGGLALPDGTVAALRVGMDAAPLDDFEGHIRTRQRTLDFLIGLLVVAAVGVAVLLGRWERSKEAAEQANRLREEEGRRWEAIGQMAATVAHEVRSPLNTIKMAAQRLRAEFDVPAKDRSEFREMTEFLETEADRVDRVVGDFLEIGRPLVLERQRLPAARLLEEAVLPYRLRAEREQKYLVVDNRCSRDASVDPGRFGQIIGNLVANALDAVVARGTVRVVASCEPEGLHVVVEDDGPGMDAETLERVEQPFVSTKAHGTGLGLPLARRLIGAHGGRLRLHSMPGKGTRAEVFLPAPSRGGSVS